MAMRELLRRFPKKVAFLSTVVQSGRFGAVSLRFHQTYVPIHGTTPMYCPVFFKKMPKNWKPVTLYSAIMMTRNYYVHYGETYHSYNNNQRTKVTVYDAERDFFIYYPQLLPAMYKAMEEKNITYLL